MADIYTLFNFLEKKNIYLHDHNLTRKILTCLFPIMPNLSISLNESIFNANDFDTWPIVDLELLKENEIRLPIQIQGKLVTTIDTVKGYKESEILKEIYKLDKIKNKIENKKIVKVINVQDKIINIITS